MHIYNHYLHTSTRFPCFDFLQSVYHLTFYTFHLLVYHLFTQRECALLQSEEGLFALFTLVSQCQEQCLAHSSCSINICLMNKQYDFNFGTFSLNPTKSWKQELEDIPQISRRHSVSVNLTCILLSGTSFPLIFLRQSGSRNIPN